MPEQSFPVERGKQGGNIGGEKIWAKTWFEIGGTRGGVFLAADQAHTYIPAYPPTLVIGQMYVFKLYTYPFSNREKQKTRGDKQMVNRWKRFSNSVTIFCIT